MIVIQPASLLQMKEHAVVIFPDECCGFLYGQEAADGERVISTIQPVDNAKDGDKRRRFAITAKDYLRAEHFALEQHLSLLGIYHSHPNHPAIPSEHDRVAAQPYFSYVIVSVMNGSIDHIRSWRLNDQFIFDEENLSSHTINQTL